MDGFLVWGLAIVMTAGCVLHARYVMKGFDESIGLTALFVLRGMAAGSLALCYWSQILGLATADEIVPIVRGFGIPASIAAYVLPPLLKPRSRLMADGIVDEVRRKLEE